MIEPCPICATPKPTVLHHHDPDNGMWGATIQCARESIPMNMVSERCWDRVTSCKQPTREDAERVAVEAWNKRAGVGIHDR